MNIFTKVSLLAVSAVAVVGAFSGCSMATSRITAALPHTSEVTTEAGRVIAADLTAQLNAAKSMPRATRVMQVASVEIADVSDVVVVEARRLPANQRLVETSVAQNVSL